MHHESYFDPVCHACLHFPRTMAQVTSIGPYATKHQNAVDKAWAELQASLN